MIFWHLGLYVLHFKGLRYKYGFYCHILCYHLVLSNISKENYCYICITRFFVFVFGTKLKTSFLDEHWCDKSEWETISTLTAVCVLFIGQSYATNWLLQRKPKSKYQIQKVYMLQCLFAYGKANETFFFSFSSIPLHYPIWYASAETTPKFVILSPTLKRWITH